MTVRIDSPFMSAQHDPSTTATSPHHTGPAGRSHGEGVNTVELFPRRAGRKRAWDEMSATDRAVLLEAVRQRREAQEQRRAAQQPSVSSRHLR